MGKSSGLAVVLSFFIPGLGQIYNGQIGKGVLMVLASFISVVLMLIVIGFVLYLLLWVYGMYDAYTTAEGINRAEQAQGEATPPPAPVFAPPPAAPAPGATYCTHCGKPMGAGARFCADCGSEMPPAA